MINKKTALTSSLKKLDGIGEFINEFNKHKTGIVSGIIEAAKGHLIYTLSEFLNVCPFVIASSEEEGETLKEDLAFLFGEENVMYYPSRDILFYNADVHSNDIVKQRIEVLDAIIKNKNMIIVTTIDALLNPLSSKEKFVKSQITIKNSDTLDLEILALQLIEIGYERTARVETVGQFALRGGIIDIFSPANNAPVRIELWDTLVDSIRRFSPITQRSIDKTDKVTLYPNQEIIISKEALIKAVPKIQEELKLTVQTLRNNDQEEVATKLEDKTTKDIEEILEGRHAEVQILYAPFCDLKTTTIFSYLQDDKTIFITDVKKCKNKLYRVFTEYEESVKSRLEYGHILPNMINFIFNKNDIISQIFKNNYVAFMNFFIKDEDIITKNILEIKINDTSTKYKNLKTFEDELKDYKKQNKITIFLAGTKTKAVNIVKQLEEQQIYTALGDLNYDVQKGQILVTSGSLKHGFIYEDIGFVILSDRELFGKDKKTTSNKKKYKGAKIESFLELIEGDYVVHENHGIGVFVGIEKIVTDGVARDNLKINYNGGVLYVNINQMDLVQKYVGSEGSVPKLNTLGNPEWKKAKTKAKCATKNIAKELIALYSKREHSRGFVYEQDSIWQTEFEEMFPYQETSDQLDAIKAVKEDMQSDKIMDRLVLGDVGYGKTEVAIRAAFKAVLNQKQVAYLVPTTVLSQQHYERFLKRMEAHAVSVGVLSRFRTPKQVKETLKGLEQGTIDIVIGTHRLLSKDVKFKDLGLIIIDEEQRFGVTHKEKLKLLRTEVDALTLTATPIPRTLQMSLIGIRDMSVIEEAPSERRAVQTYVLEESDEFIKDAINREINREGQVYFLSNRVQNIEEKAMKLSAMVPNAKVAFAHGQMSVRELEDIMERFENKEINVLVCTTIIETGLDIANANTIIINDADKMGLSQLYQLRGRVGRSDKQAYAYLLYQKDKTLSEIAEKRLNAIKQFTQLGAGFKIAMRDLEIRGAGDLLGASQSGHMEKIGYELYSKMLKEAIQIEQGAILKEKIETTVEIKINAFIPNNYIKDEIQKLDIYKKIASIQNEEDYHNVIEEITDRYGDIPTTVLNLLDIAIIKALANEQEISLISQNIHILMLKFSHKAKGKSLSLLAKKYSHNMKVNIDKEVKILFDMKEIHQKDYLNFIKNVLFTIKEQEINNR
ncbi:transcription-repair coupling factor [Candidatus Epulonipiscioides gigas]|nr:transcription-repair coupling factor [Epulopiscium sp. SCG-C07WGA-EpuloA2]